MDPTIFQFMAGIMAGTLTGLLIVRRKASGKKYRPKTATVRTRPMAAATKYRVVARPMKTGNNRQKNPARLSRTRTLAPAAFIPQATTTASIGAVVTPSFASCPSCGLEAPEVLMEEHFVQSPSHKAGHAPALPAMVRMPAPTFPLESGEGEESKLSFRNLLQMLVPPRAFGHRHQQRTVNPLSRMVQAIEVPSPRSGQ
jgi:hypothetical protein